MAKKKFALGFFCFWNEPSSSNMLFGFDRDETFYKLYENSYREVKAVDEDLLFGGPSAFSTYGKNEDWLFRFLSFTKSHHCVPDFINLHYYDIDLSIDDSKWMLTGKNRIYLSADPSSFHQFIDRLHNRLNDEGYGSIPVYLTEWNSTGSHTDLLNDTCFKAVYFAKNILENYDALAGFSYWCLTDLHQENILDNIEFHGGLGLFTMSGIEKPVYQAYHLLHNIGEEKLNAGDGYFISRSGEKMIIHLYNYCHFHEAYAHDFGINTTLKSRYNVFPTQQQKAFKITIATARNYKVRKTTINRENGSSFDMAINLGLGNEMSSEEIATIRALSRPKIETSIVKAENGILTYDLMLEPFAVVMVELIPCY